MIQFSNVEKSYGARELFKGVTFALSAGERLAIIGRNGTGKSTIFRLILGDESPDQGEVIVPKGYKIGHLSQHLEFHEANVLDEVCRGLPPGREDERYRGEILLSGLGFSSQDFELPAAQFSGGFQIRVELARVLLSEPNLLLLDEPTNYLDIVSARWLEGYFREWPNEIMIISHDRTFLDKVSTHTMILHRGQVRKVSGGTAKLTSLIEQDEQIYEQTRLNQEKKRREVEQFIAKFKAKAGTASLAQSRAKMLEKMETGEALREEEVLDFSFASAPFFGKLVLEVDGMTFAYPAQNGRPEVPIVKDFTFAVQKGDRIGVIGKNGKGKSTLLRLLAGEIAPDAGSVRLSAHAKVGYFGQTNIQRLTPTLTIEEEIGQANQQLHRTKVRGICGTMMFSGDDAEKKIKILSGGEKSRVLLGKLLAQTSNLLLLDEPTNHLDIESVAALCESLETYEGAVILVTHDEFMLRKLARRLVLFGDDGVRVIEGDYEYFLSTIGWGDGEEAVPSKRAGGKRKGDGERKNRAKLRELRNERLAPLDKEIAEVEAEIVKLEELVKENDRKLVDSAASKNTQGLAELSKSTAFARTEVEKLFSKLESLSAERVRRERELDAVGVDEN